MEMFVECSFPNNSCICHNIVRGPGAYKLDCFAVTGSVVVMKIASLRSAPESTETGPQGRGMSSSGMLRRVALVRTNVSEKLSAYFIRLTRIGELGTTLVVTSNRRTQRRNS
jgi:hypothetical protein